MFGLGMPEILVILLIALLVFGAGKLPDVGSSLGKAIRGFKGALDAKEEPPAKPTGATAGGPGGTTCPACGKNYTGEAAFCPSCGKPLKG